MLLIVIVSSASTAVDSAAVGKETTFDHHNQQHWTYDEADNSNAAAVASSFNHPEERGAIWRTNNHREQRKTDGLALIWFGHMAMMVSTSCYPIITTVICQSSGIACDGFLKLSWKATDGTDYEKKPTKLFGLIRSRMEYAGRTLPINTTR